MLITGIASPAYKVTQCSARYAILISRLQSAPVYWRNELRVGPLVAHHQTVFVTAVLLPTVSSSKTSSNIVTTKPQCIIVHQPSSPLPVMRAPRITTCRLLTRFASVNSIINRNAVAIVSSPGKFLSLRVPKYYYVAEIYLFEHINMYI